MGQFKKSIGLLAFAIFIIGGLVIIIKSEVTKPAPNNVRSDLSSNGSNSASLASASGYTLSEVAKHSSNSNCWTAINGEVYDVTPFIDQHPGGSGAILFLCGIDGSEAFNNQHGGQNRPANELAGLKIGVLKN